MMKFLLIAFAIAACFAIGQTSYGVGYREGLRVVWIVETLGRCDLETGKILP